MKQHIIEYQGKEYRIEEPTIAVWKKIYTQIDILSDEDFSVTLLEASTGIPKEELSKLNWYDVETAANNIMEFYNDMDSKFHEKFEFKGKTYKFVNLPKLSFGHYVDIDSYLGKSELERINNLNYYLSLLYVEEGVDPNDTELRRERAELFNELPIKYYLGSNSFFLSLGQILQRSTTNYFYRLYLTIWTKWWNLNVVLGRFGGGIQRLVNSLRTILRELKKSLDNRSSLR